MAAPGRSAKTTTCASRCEHAADYAARPGSLVCQRQLRHLLIDAFGNRELIYRDPEISCHQPIPLRPRPKPPVAAETSKRLAGVPTAEATVIVNDVYDSLQPWPADTKITALRVWQILPLSVAPAARNNGIQVPGTGSINTGRAVLGTVRSSPRQSEFLVPAGKEVFFQALDEQGLAVQSMRSGTHFQPGETRVCMGCHEPKQRCRGPDPSNRWRHAGRRRVCSPTSTARMRSAMPAWCSLCWTDIAWMHAKNAEKAMGLDAEPMMIAGQAYMDLNTTYFTSYVNLAPQFGYYSYGDAGGRTHRTTPGQFGARASRLYALLTKGHYDVTLPPDDLHRLTVWLDSCSMFYGVYEEEGGKAQLRGEIVRPTLE